MIHTLQCWVLRKKISSIIFKVFGMTRPGIEPKSTGPLANTLSTRPMSRLGRFNEVTLPTHKYAYLYSHTCTIQIWPYSTRIEDIWVAVNSRTDQVYIFTYVLPTLQFNHNQHCQPQPTQQIFIAIVYI